MNEEKKNGKASENAPRRETKNGGSGRLRPEIAKRAHEAVEPEVKTLFVNLGTFAPVTDAELAAFFTSRGFAVERACVIRERETGYGKGFGFVDLRAKQEAVDAAIKAVNGTDHAVMIGRESFKFKLVVNQARPKEQAVATESVPQPSLEETMANMEATAAGNAEKKAGSAVESAETFTKTLFVGNLPPMLTSEALTVLAQEGGFRARAKVITERETGVSKRFAFVDVGTDAEAAELIERLNGLTLTETIDGVEYKFQLVANEARPRSAAA